MASEKLFCANGCGTEITPAKKGDFFGCCGWDCLETQKAIYEFERIVMEPPPAPVQTITTTGANPFGRRREVI